MLREIGRIARIARPFLNLLDESIGQMDARLRLAAHRAIVIAGGPPFKPAVYVCSGRGHE